MNRQEASLFFRLRVVPFSPVPPNECAWSGLAHLSVSATAFRCLLRRKLCKGQNHSELHSKRFILATPHNYEDNISVLMFWRT
jgi:hypothetical protein